MSHVNAPSPATFPMAHTACSRTAWLSDLHASSSSGSALADMIAWVCSEVPEAMFVRAQAASNCAQDVISMAFVAACLQCWVVVEGEEVHELGNSATVDDLLNRGIAL